MFGQSEPLVPFNPPIQLFDAYTFQHPATIVLKEKLISASGDSFDITLDNGQPLIRVKGKLATISGRKSVFDTNNVHLFDIIKKHFHLHTTFVAEDPSGKEILEVKCDLVNCRFQE